MVERRLRPQCVPATEEWPVRRPRCRNPWYLSSVALRRLTLLASLPLAVSVAAAAPAQAVDWYTVPGSYNASGGITTAPDGTVWFGANGAFHDPAMGRLIPSLGTPGATDGMTGRQI